MVGTVPLDLVEVAETLGNEFSDLELVFLRRRSLKKGMICSLLGSCFVHESGKVGRSSERLGMARADSRSKLLGK